ncbi:MAG TPA: carboxypeptidase regulatory-like domain-containing protein [Myxococcaceae bacterium]|nr:carboxypeptidase regulatory-like domain-containing protein [Myxococcaceae bacterium]
MSVKSAGGLVALGVALAVLVGCPGKKDPVPDAGVPDAGSGGGGGRCAVDRDCPDPRIFSCNSATFRCEPSCAVKEDCSAAKRGTHAIAACDTAPGCQCDEGRCVKALCSADAECGAQVCRDGACVPVPEVGKIASCQLWPDFVVGRVGERVELQLLAQDANGAPVVPVDGVSWTAGPGMALAGSGTGQAVLELRAATLSAVQGLQARMGGATCAVSVRVLEAGPEEGWLRVTVTDEFTGRPIPGATVLLSHDEGLLSGERTTGESGVVSLPLVDVPSGGTFVNVTAFHPDYGYLTLAGYELGGPVPASRDVSLPLRRNPNDAYGGYQGTFKNAPATSNAHLGLAGLSVGGGLMDLTPGLLLGPTTPSSVHVGTAVNLDNLPLPSGMFLSVGDTPSKSTISARGLPGVCARPLRDEASAEDAIRAGRCGTRSAWAFTADLPVTDLPLASLVGGAGNINLAALLTGSIPLFKSFSSSVVRDVPYALNEAPTDGGIPDTSSVAGFVPLDHSFSQPPNVPLGFGFVARVPSLPRIGTGYVDSVLLLGTSAVPGRGLVPLGLGAGVNSNADALTDIQSGLPAQGLVAVRMAPAHHGLEGSGYGLVAVAMALENVTDASLGFAASALYQRLPPGPLPFDPKGERPVKLEGAFMGFPTGARYNFDAMARPGLAARQLKFASDPGLVGLTAARALFADAAGRTWTVLLNPARLLTGARLPVPPRGFADRTFATPAQQLRSTLTVQALRLGDRLAGSGPLPFQRFVELTAARPDLLMERLQAFSSLDYGRPDARWTSPAQDDQRLAVGELATVKVTGFKVGEEGKVLVTFDGCAAEPRWLAADPSQGKGELSVPVPSGCKGTVLLTAELYEGTLVPQPLAPRVVATRRIVVP